MKDMTVTISTWGELKDFVCMLDMEKQTIELTGWVNSIHKTKVELKSLIFSTKNVEVKKNDNTKVVKKPMVKNPKKQ